jgi:hypothetical protein
MRARSPQPEPSLTAANAERVSAATTRVTAGCAG